MFKSPAASDRAPGSHGPHRRFAAQAAEERGPQNISGKTYEAFEFTVPARTIAPKLQGSFQSFVKGSGDNIVSNETANVDVLLLNEEEFDVFTSGKEGTATYTQDPSNSQTVEVALASTVEQPRKYYLVFRNSPGGPKTKFVKADFTASFE